MAAFDKIYSGFPQMDEILDYIRLGDNVVWQVSSINEFRVFAEPFARQAVKDGRKVIYIRFAQHDPVLKDLSGIKVYEFNPDKGFEAFTVSIHERITQEGRDAFYVFDCLSELQSVWYTDLMMGNFFRVTCPYLFELDTVAYFPLLRGRHSFDAVARIRDTTQLLLDVYSNETYLYLHPLKVWNRYSSRMFLPHCCRKADGSFSPIEDGVGMSRYYQTIQKYSANSPDQNYDSHDRFFAQAKLDFSRGYFSPETEDLIIDSTMTKDERLKALVKRYFKPQDYFMLRDRMIGTGAIGGKACGMLLARKIAETEIPEFFSYSEPHDSFYIGSDVFYTYIVSNDCWRLRIRQRTKKEYFTAAKELKEHLFTGEFPTKIREQFLNVIEYFGQSPFIVRSSSFLEDGFGNAFAGKYESVFCVNQGDPQKRLEEFEQAVRTVYASTMDYSALEYRLLRGLEKKDEQMAILVQRVSGSYQGKYFMPCAAGVGYSHSAYKWYPDMDPDAGMLRIVMGLGTKAVDRTKEDYPRLANLDRPTATVLTTVEQKHKFSQRNIDVLDCEEDTLKEVPLETLLPILPLWYKKIVLEHDYDAEYRLRQMGRYQDVWFVSCQKLLEKKEFTALMQKILKTLEHIYENPVDIEYTVNVDESGDFVVNLLQCRPLYLGQKGEKIDLTDLKLKEVFFEIKDSSMGNSGKRKIDVVIQVDPVLYYQYPYRKKYDVAAALGKINRHFRGTGKNILLMTPGRIGTSSPELGVPVTFGDISNFSAVCEVSDSRAGYMPELSYGSHMFQDLVEAEILYGAIWNNAKTLSYHPELFGQKKDLFSEICPDMKELCGIIKVYAAENLYYWLDAVSNHAVCGVEDAGD
ncbi:MAG TPA: PEP/pyruvate-binding domain-containing protein [Candidatus Blautia faecavium]|uniref:PEP/pyruvate-binding domain-containing protein n=1 Tax=Candidatus Blautia faecavium TaxID=2838487 RepID=A0A9D2RUJ5_9FIRM|nr:PEP/pyruvate-binding domain-containing protein [Candidatus Blautia faecavium]